MAWPKMNEEFCCRCKEDFPLHTLDRPSLGQPMSMGQLFPLKDVLKILPKRHRCRQSLTEWLEREDGAFLCGMCFFNITEGEPCFT